jgi:hypothetical protein
VKKGARKIATKKAAGIVNLAAWRDAQLDEIDSDIERVANYLAELQSERDRIYRSYNDRQLSLKFGVTATTVHRIVKGKCWQELTK